MSSARARYFSTVVEVRIPPVARCIALIRKGCPMETKADRFYVIYVVSQFPIGLFNGQGSCKKRLLRCRRLSCVLISTLEWPHPSDYTHEKRHSSDVR